MTIDSQNLLESILQSLDRVSYIRPEEIPGIDLYMDQVTTFMDSHLSASRRYEDDKILTKTMINNYAKNRLLPPPEKKKYSREHMLLLIFIYYFKSLLSINDIQSLLSPLTERYFHTERPLSLEQVYSEVFSLEKSQIRSHEGRSAAEIQRFGKHLFRGSGGRAGISPPVLLHLHAELRRLSEKTGD